MRELVVISGKGGTGKTSLLASFAVLAGQAVLADCDVAGAHDLERVLTLCRHFRIPAAVCVNKWDLNQGMSERIETLAREKGARVTGRIPYDRTVTVAQIQARSVVEIGGTAAQAVRHVWEKFTTIGEANGATRRAAERAN